VQRRAEEGEGGEGKENAKGEEIDVRVGREARSSIDLRITKNLQNVSAFIINLPSLFCTLPPGSPPRI